ncbi:MAG: MG2 domain-containing protein, partial [Polyangiales bacterium]
MRLRIALISLLLVPLAGSCGSPAQPAPESASTLAEDGPRGLFSALEPPTVETDAPPGLVLRDGPEVPEPGRQEMPFPPPEPPEGEAPEAKDPGPLEVRSWAPKGDDELVGAVRVTFSQPMVPIAALSDLKRRDVPLEIDPMPKGRFRWLGTTTLAFEPEGRMPKATDYTVRVPEGTQSKVGGELEETLEFSFQTPPPGLRFSMPTHGARSVGLEPTVALCFDQRVDPETIAEGTSIAGAGNPELSLVTGDAVRELAKEHMQLQSCEDDRRVVFRVAEPLRKATGYRVRIAAGTRGAEGPKPIPKTITKRFRTYAPLRLEKVDCSNYRGPCRPGHHVMAKLNNRLATDQDPDELVEIEPDVPRLERRIVGTYVRLSGDFEPRTTYRIALSPELRDEHGQTLGSPDRSRVRFGDAWPYARVPTDDVASLEPDTARALPVELMNVGAVRARVAPVPPERVGKVLETLDRGRWRWRRKDEEDPFAKARLRPRGVAVPVRGARNEEQRVGVPLASAIASGESGYALAHVKGGGRRVNLERYVLVQATDLGVLAHVDHAGAVARVTSLSSGEPVEGARVALYPRDLTGGNDALASKETDAQGMVRFDRGARRPVRVVARKGEDEAFVVVNPGTERERLVGSVFTDRDPYRPGDTVHIHGIVRERDATASAQVHPLDAGTTLRCEVRDRRHREKDRIEVELSAYGTFDHELKLPTDAATGMWRIACQHGGTYSGVNGRFRVEEYRAPEIEVDVEAPDGPHFHGERPTLDVESRYLFGAAAAGLPVRYTLGREATRFSPPGHPGWRFGDTAGSRWPTIGTSRWTRRHGRHRMVREHLRGRREIIDRGSAELDDEGRLRIPVE